MTAYRDKMVTCTQCQQPTHWLATFPGRICLECYKQTDDARRPLTERDIVEMWGGKMP